MLLKFENETEWLAARKQDVTSTEVAALFGLNPYKSRLRLWHEKRGDVESDFEDNPFTKWGRRLQNAVAEGIAEDEGWDEVEDLRLYYARDPDLGLGSSFDFKVIAEGLPTMLEIKVAEAFREEDGWLPDKAPIPYEFQLQTQLHFSREKGIKHGIIGTLGRRQSTRLYRREYDASVGSMIEEEVFTFWQSIKLNRPPEPDYAVDSELLEKLRGPIRTGDIINLTGNDRAKELVAHYKNQKSLHTTLMKELKPVDDSIEKIKAELLHMIGRNETAIIGGIQISAKEQVREDSVSYGSSFRRFDLKKRKQ